VTLQLLRAIQDAIGKRDKEKEWTTRDVVKKLIIPWTRWTKLSLVDLLLKKHAEKPHNKLKVTAGDVVGGGEEKKATADYFLIHAWDANFHQLCDAVDKWVSTHTDKKNYYLDKRTCTFWVDFCVYNQWHHRASSANHAVPVAAFKDLIMTSVPNAVIVMSPWDEPLCCTRAWCLWELFCAIKAQEGTRKYEKHQVSVAMSDKEINHMKLACRSHPDELLDWNATIRVGIAKASRKRDKAAIEAALVAAQLESIQEREAEAARQVNSPPTHQPAHSFVSYFLNFPSLPCCALRGGRRKSSGGRCWGRSTRRSRRRATGRRPAANVPRPRSCRSAPSRGAGRPRCWRSRRRSRSVPRSTETRSGRKKNGGGRSVSKVTSQAPTLYRPLSRPLAQLFYNSHPPFSTINPAAWGELTAGGAAADPREVLMYQPGLDGVNERLSAFLVDTVARDYTEYSHQTLGRYEINWAKKEVS